MRCAIAPVWKQAIACSSITSYPLGMSHKSRRCTPEMVANSSIILETIQVTGGSFNLRNEKRPWKGLNFVEFAGGGTEAAFF